MNWDPLDDLPPTLDEPQKKGFRYFAKQTIKFAFFAVIGAAFLVWYVIDDSARKNINYVIAGLGVYLLLSMQIKELVKQAVREEMQTDRDRSARIEAKISTVHSIISRITRRP